MGNQRFKEIAASRLQDYSNAPTKSLKSDILSSVVSSIRSRSAHQAGFVRYDAGLGRWVVVDDSQARTTVAQQFRDALQGDYKSSKAFKQKRRRVNLKLSRKQKSNDHKKLPPPAHETRNSPSRPDIIYIPTSQLKSRELRITDAQLPRIPMGDERTVSLLNPLRHPGDSTSLSLSFTPNTDTLEAEHQSRVFDVLYANFDAASCYSSNPFEPTPILDQRTAPSASLLLSRNRRQSFHQAQPPQSSFANDNDSLAKGYFGQYDPR